MELGHLQWWIKILYFLQWSWPTASGESYTGVMMPNSWKKCKNPSTYYYQPTAGKICFFKKGTPHSSKLQHYSNLTIRLFSIISRTHIGVGVLPLCREAVGVFYNPSQLGNCQSGHFLFPYIKDKFWNSGFIFQHNLAPSYTIKFSKKWFREKRISVLDWAA